MTSIITLDKMGVQQLDAHIERCEHLLLSVEDGALKDRLQNDLRDARVEWNRRFPDAAYTEV